MKKKPDKQNILKGIKGFILFAGLITFLIAFLFFYWNIENIEKARTMVVTASIVFEMFLVFNCKSTKSVFKSPFNKYLYLAVSVSIVLHLLVLYTPLSNLFHFVSLGFVDWAQIIVISSIGFLLMEGFKKFQN